MFCRELTGFWALALPIPMCKATADLFQAAVFRAQASTDWDVMVTLVFVEPLRLDKA